MLGSEEKHWGLRYCLEQPVVTLRVWLGVKKKLKEERLYRR